MTTNTRIDLQVPYSEKDQAKVHGAQWDTENRTWYAPPGTDLQNLIRWLPKGVLTENPNPATTAPKKAEKGVSLSELLGQVNGVVYEGFANAEVTFSSLSWAVGTLISQRTCVASLSHLGMRQWRLAFTKETGQCQGPSNGRSREPVLDSGILPIR
jgi:hypothetical protein